MGILPVLKPQEVVNVLKRLGFIEVRQKGSHKQFKHPDGELLQFLFIKGEIFRRCSSGKLPKILMLK